MSARIARTRHLVFVLGDQLSLNLPSLRASDPARDVVVMAEVHSETTYVRHHKKKIAFVLSAMRHFAEELRALGWRVVYRTLADTGADGTLTGELLAAIKRLRPERVVVTEAGEWRLRQEMCRWTDLARTPVDILPDDRFIASHEEFAAWARDRKALRMEYFYRDMRRKTGLLMNGAEPEGGQWNFDKENRKPARADLFLPVPLRIEPDATTREVLTLVGERFSGHFGDLEPFWFGVTRADAERALDRFVKEALPDFGAYQDAMLEGERFLYHSVLSLYINVGLLDPLAVCRRIDAAYRKGGVPLNSAEGFIRQIIGWREYVRGIYWLRMPGYAAENAFAHARPLPAFYWTADTAMACVRAAVTQTKEEAYAHHIQRLMVTGNFALLAGVSPQELHEWYLAVYADAYEWVELPNTLGMSQFADGGLLASKPYVSSGAYIDRMSDHCRNCRYEVGQSQGPDACPFNPLYWHFLVRHRDKLAANMRLKQVYATWDRMAEDKQAERLASAASVLERLDQGTL